MRPGVESRRRVQGCDVELDSCGSVSFFVIKPVSLRAHRPLLKRATDASLEPMASTSIAFRPVVVACTATSGSITRRRTSSRANHHERRAQSNADRHPRLRRPPRGSSPTDGARGGYGARGRVQGCDGDAAGVRIGPERAPRSDQTSSRPAPTHPRSTSWRMKTKPSVAPSAPQSNRGRLPLEEGSHEGERQQVQDTHRARVRDVEVAK